MLHRTIEQAFEIEAIVCHFAPDAIGVQVRERRMGGRVATDRHRRRACQSVQFGLVHEMGDVQVPKRYVICTKGFVEPGNTAVVLVAPFIDCFE